MLLKVWPRNAYSTKGCPQEDMARTYRTILSDQAGKPEVLYNTTDEIAFVFMSGRSVPTSGSIDDMEVTFVRPPQTHLESVSRCILGQSGTVPRAAWSACGDCCSPAQTRRSLAAHDELSNRQRPPRVLGLRLGPGFLPCRESSVWVLGACWPFGFFGTLLPSCLCGE